MKLTEVYILKEAKCPKCGDKDAYQGFNSTECTNKSCPNFSQKQYDEVNKDKAGSSAEYNAASEKLNLDIGDYIVNDDWINYPIIYKIIGRVKNKISGRDEVEVQAYYNDGQKPAPTFLDIDEISDQYDIEWHNLYEYQPQYIEQHADEAEDADPTFTGYGVDNGEFNIDDYAIDHVVKNKYKQS